MFNAASTNLIWARLIWPVCSDGQCTQGASAGLVAGAAITQRRAEGRPDNHLLEVRPGAAVPSVSVRTVAPGALGFRVGSLHFQTAFFSPPSLSSSHVISHQTIYTSPVLSSLSYLTEALSNRPGVLYVVAL